MIRTYRDRNHLFVSLRTDGLCSLLRTCKKETTLGDSIHISHMHTVSTQPLHKYVLQKISFEFSVSANSHFAQFAKMC